MGVPVALFAPGDLQYPTANYALLATRNNRPYIVFPPNAATTGYFTGFVPSNYDPSVNGLTVEVYYALAATETNTGVVWQAGIERITSAQDADADGFDAVVEATSTAHQSTDNVVSKSISLTTADVDALASGEPFRLELVRAGTATDDDSAATAQVYLIAVTQV